jgi:O-antigen/teichoic acid export membrane protein
MSFLTSDTEVGWYGAAATLAGMSLLLAPIVGSVLGPLASRAAARDGDGAELMLVNRRALEAVLSVSLPASLLLYLGAEPVVELMFGPEFAPAARSLRLLAPTFVLTYLAMVSGTILVRLERAWAMTWVTVAGMVLSPALNLVLVPAGLRLLGRGGAGVGAGAALVLTETFTAGVFLWLVGRRGVDRRLAVALGKMIAVCAAVAAADALLAPLGIWRLAVDALLYAAGVLATGAVHAGDALGLVRGLVASRRRAPAAAGAAS